MTPGRPGAIAAAGWAAAAVVSAGLLPQWHPVIDSLAQFRLLALSALAVVAVVGLVQRRWLSAATWAGLGAGALVATSPFLPGIGPLGDAGREGNLRVVQFNLSVSNPDPDAAAARILEARPDVALLQEIVEATRPVLAALAGEMPHQIECTVSGNASVAIASRHAFVAGSAGCWLFEGFTRATLDHPAGPITVASIHLKWPWPRPQKTQLASLRPRLEALPARALLAGDFNAVPWSATVRDTARLARMSVVRGAPLSWGPRWRRFDRPPIPILPIDQILHGPDLEPIERRVLADAGSDHLPILTRFALASGDGRP